MNYYQQEKERELEELKKTNPEMAWEAMEKLEKTRIAERATLKHRNSSKYLQMQSRQVELFHSKLRLRSAKPFTRFLRSTRGAP